MLNKQGRVGESGVPCTTSCLGDASANRNCGEQISALRTDQDKNQRVGGFLAKSYERRCEGISFNHLRWRLKRS